MIVWTKDETKPGTWDPIKLHKFNDVVWHLSWSFAGNILAVSGGDNSVSSRCLHFPAIPVYDHEEPSGAGCSKLS